MISKSFAQNIWLTAAVVSTYVVIL